MHRDIAAYTAGPFAWTAWKVRRETKRGSTIPRGHADATAQPSKRAYGGCFENDGRRIKAKADACVRI